MSTNKTRCVGISCEFQDGCAGRPLRRRPPELLEHTPPRCRHNCPTPSPPLSINRPLALHPRERLMVHLICWADRQLAVLGCRIHSRAEESLVASANEDTVAASPKADRLALRLSRPQDKPAIRRGGVGRHSCATKPSAYSTAAASPVQLRSRSLPFLIVPSHSATASSLESKTH